MKNIVLNLAFVLVLSSCALAGSREFENHIISMHETIDDKHVKYRDGILLIDEKQIEIPEGDMLNISYRRNHEFVRYTVRVDGEVIAEAENAAET